ncbi:hypothetical protein [Acinetobacter beijerinckii]|uniref:hypothetical protein n=1 Tax=Acinetobacter beijerinckii TaxID=262668 RepID=UPI004054D8F0
MVASTDIKFYVHTNTNAPQLQNAFGGMIDVLDACLVNGFGSQSVATLTASGTTVTATFGSAHNYLQYQVIKIAGANQTEFNGEHRILTVPNANTITFGLSAVPSVTTVTGTITSSLPSLGWLKPFTGTGKAAYRSSNTLLASRPYLRVIDALDPAYTSTYAKYAKVGIVEDMSSIDGMFGVQAPYDATLPDKNWIGTGSGTTAINGWAKWYYTHSSAFTASANDVNASASGSRSWVLVGNSDYFYILPTATTSNSYALCYGFGGFEALSNSDQSTNFLSATFNYIAANISFYRGTFTGCSGTDANQKVLIQRLYNQTTQYAESKTISLGAASSINSGSSNYIGASALNNISPFAPVFLNETVLRGKLPNLHWLFQNKPYANYGVFENNSELFLAVYCASGTTSEGQLVLKIGEL